MGQGHGPAHCATAASRIIDDARDGSLPHASHARRRPRRGGSLRRRACACAPRSRLPHALHCRCCCPRLAAAGAPRAAAAPCLPIASTPRVACPPARPQAQAVARLPRLRRFACLAHGGMGRSDEALLTALLQVRRSGSLALWCWPGGIVGGAVCCFGPVPAARLGAEDAQPVCVSVIRHRHAELHCVERGCVAQCRTQHPAVEHVALPLLAWGRRDRSGDACRWRTLTLLQVRRAGAGKDEGGTLMLRENTFGWTMAGPLASRSLLADVATPAAWPWFAAKLPWAG